MISCTSSIRTQTEAFTAATADPRAVTESALAAIAAQDSSISAFACVTPALARAAAAESATRYAAGTPRGPLDGITVTIKDLYDIAGVPTRSGSRLTPDAPALANAPAVQRLIDAGAVILGKTATPEWGHKGVTSHPVSGMITRNPRNPAKTAGGSSGGAAAACAAGLGTVHLGSDAGGSVRIPACFCGVTGFKPTPLRVPVSPPSLFQPLSSIGVLANCIDDAAAMMRIISQPDARDPYARPWPGATDTGIRRIGFITALETDTGIVPVAPAVADAIASTRAHWQTIAPVDDITLSIPTLITTFNRHWMAVATYMTRHLSDAARADTDPRLLEWGGMGESLPASDYIAAVHERLKISESLNALLSTYDILISPTVAFTAFDTGTDMPMRADGTPWLDWTPYTYIANLAQLPAVSLPCGVDGGGLPVGLQIMAAHGADARVIAAARHYESFPR